MLNLFPFITGAAPPKLTLGKLKNIPIPVPLIPEQQKIADCLTSLENIITKQSQKLDTLKAHKKGLMQNLFPANGKTTPKLRFSEFKDDWQIVKLGDIAEISTGNSNREDSSGDSGKYTFFDRSQDIRTSDTFIFDSEAIIVGGEGKDFIPKYFIGKFDLHQRAYAIINFLNSLSKFIFYYIHQNKNYFLSQAVGSTVKSLRLPMFQKMPIELPQLKEQQKIADCLTSIDDIISKQSQKLDTLKAHKKGLMQQLFPSVDEAI